MKLGVMQPYFVPYLGYFQLIAAVDTFIIYDDVNYIKGGWINRNSILSNGKAQRITLETIGASPNKLINEISIGQNQKKILSTIQQSYSKAPCFKAVFPILEDIMNYSNSNLAIYVSYSLQKLCEYLGIETNILISSNIEKNITLKGEEKIIELCKLLGVDTYINAIGGQELYSYYNFGQNGIKLNFIKMKPIVYTQFSNDFIPNLSIIDVMMFNTKQDIQAMLTQYELI